MLYAIVPVTNGEPDFDWATPVVESYQLTDTARHCIFKPGTVIRETWQVITEAEYLAVKPAIPTPPAPLTLEEIKENQLILMDAVAMLYETISSGGGA